MAISDRLLKAILSMDSYNRGYGTGINLPTTLGATKIGNATILAQSDTDPNSAAVSVGFYAISYTLSSGEVVISYRGTNADAFGNFLTDAIHGYWTGGGVPGDAQSALALKFYNAILAQHPLQPITLTGHSLGGGLAGYVGALYGKNVTLFDNMTYEDATTDAYNRSLNAYLESLPTFSGTKKATAADIALWHSIYGNNAPTTIKYDGNAFSTKNELLEHLLFERESQHISSLKIDSYSGESNLSILDLHSIALLSVLIYAKDNNLTDWQKIAAQFADAMFSDDVGSALGLKTDSNNVYAPSQQMLSMIAYSAIDSRTDGTTVFGDTGIRAMFDDANELGKVFALPTVSQTIQDTSDAIADIFVQFAGQLARGKVLQTDANAVKENVLKGVLALSLDQKTLTVNLSDTLWSVGINTGKIYGEDRLMEEFSTVKNEMPTAMQWLWNDEFGKKIDKIEFPTGDTALTSTIANRTTASNNVSLFVAGGLGDTITGSKDNDFIYGGKGADTLRGGAGDDLLAGGDDNDRLSGGLGKDFLAGGAGVDTAFYEATGAITLNVKAVAADASRFTSTVELNANGDIDHIIGVEKVELSGFDDTVIITKDPKVQFPTNIMFDGGVGNDTLTYAGTGVTTSIKEISSANETDSKGLKMELISNIENIVGTAGDDQLNIGLLASTKVKEIHTGTGNDTVWVFGSAVFANPTIYLEDGNDTLNSATRGSIIYGGAGSDIFQIGQDYLIADADATDVIMYGTQVLHGGVTWEGQESPWAKGMGGIRYGKNSDGELVIKDPYGRETFVANFNGGITGERTAGIMIGEMSLHTYRLFDAPHGAQIYETFEAIFGYYLKAMTGKSYFAGVDPLVLDLDGDGLELNARTSIAPYYDIDGDGFGEQTGWVRGDDAFLVRDLNVNGKIDSVKEMFGNGTTTGFAALKVLDSNNDGKLKAANDNYILLFQKVV